MLFQELKKRRLQAMKNKESATANLLGTLISEASKESKEPSDEQIQRTAKKFKQDALETKRELEQRGQDTSAQDSEIEVLDTILPQELSESEIEQIVERIISETGASSMKDMKLVMPKLKEYGQAMDMKVANEKVKSRLG